MATIMSRNQLVKVNQSKVWLDRGEWHDVPLPETLQEPLKRDDQQLEASPGPAQADQETAPAQAQCGHTFLDSC